MNTTGVAAGRDAAAREVAARMAAAAAAWLDTLDPDQRAVATGDAPSADDQADAERRRWFYTPTDHGGLPLGDQRPGQQHRAHQVVATGLSNAGYVTVATIIGLDNVLDHVEGWSVDWGRERGRDPGLYYLRVFGEPGGAAPWGWRFGGHHISLNNLVVDGVVRSTTPCFLGADPAVSPLLGPAPLRPLAGAEDLARELVRSLDPGRAARAILLDRAPADIIGGNRASVADGDRMLYLRDVWRRPFTEPDLAERIARMDADAERASGYDAGDYQRLALTSVPKGLPGPGTRRCSSGSCCARCWPPTWGGSPTASRRRPTTPMTARWTPCTWPGPGPPRRASRFTTACRARGCSSSTTTPSARRTTPIRCGVTRRPTSATTSSGRTWRRTTSKADIPDGPAPVDRAKVPESSLSAGLFVHLPAVAVLPPGGDRQVPQFSPARDPGGGAGGPGR